MAVAEPLAAEVAQTAAQAREATTKRDELIRQAVREGGSLREVGELAGLSHSAVRRIVQRA
ncbi:MAG: hypothetical protein JJT89_06575 [Nitriliruptoraceae bacterium]|nr:hypothetical protein [Nitriliruptoraceae bacterium]